MHPKFSTLHYLKYYSKVFNSIMLLFCSGLSSRCHYLQSHYYNATVCDEDFCWFLHLPCRNRTLYMEGQYWNKNNSRDTQIFCTGRLSALKGFLVLVLWSSVLVLTYPIFFVPAMAFWWRQLLHLFECISPYVSLIISQEEAPRFFVSSGKTIYTYNKEIHKSDFLNCTYTYNCIYTISQYFIQIFIVIVSSFNSSISQFVKIDYFILYQFFSLFKYS